MATRVQSHTSALHSGLSSSLLTILCLGVLVWVPSLAGEEKDEKKPPIQPRVPGIFSIGPNGAQQGKTINVEILGENLDGAGGWSSVATGWKERSSAAVTCVALRKFL